MGKGKKDPKEVYQKKKTIKKNEKLKTVEKKIDTDLRRAVGDFAKSITEKFLTESPSVLIPVNSFRNIAHKLRYDDVDKFTLKPSKTFNWEVLSQNPIYASLHEKFANMNWLGIVHVNEKQMSESAVKEFYTGIQVDKPGNDLYVHICGKEVIITALTLGQALNIEWIKGDVEPPKEFNVNEAWKKLNDNDEVFPTLRSERRVIKEDVKLTLLFIRNNIWFDQSEEDYISEREVWLLSYIWNEIRWRTWLPTLNNSDLEKTIQEKAMQEESMKCLPIPPHWSNNFKKQISKSLRSLIYSMRIFQVCLRFVVFVSKDTTLISALLWNTLRKKSMLLECKEYIKGSLNLIGEPSNQVNNMGTKVNIKEGQ
ncbi:hypothetical protein COLO4_37379 [Corchorus olitorius]|uniref:Uncharacterized protein n=1 Tax=Corchorus olitorius TaxID=93759 RepID=A0A1R3G242_9ROSI|nr:hypothetical protein COLO4_37379 [Corchorus olitorius]